MKVLCRVRELEERGMVVLWLMLLWGEERG
jgi:hypothetical protein